MLAREKTRPVHLGSLIIGGGAPVSVQSMCNTDTRDVQATLAQIKQLIDAGCELIRVTLPAHDAVASFAQIVAESPIPVVADIHFDYRLAIEAANAGAAALRINPGNIGSWDKVDAVIDAAGQAGTAIRIGVNAGSLDPSFDERTDLSLPDKLVGSSVSFVDHFEQRDFTNIVLSAKAHDVPTTLQTYRKLSQELPLIPLHVGVTEAGTLMQGTVKSAVGIGSLLEEGIGDTIRVSLTADPVEEVKVGWDILAALGMRRLNAELVSCPTCGRTEVDLIALADEVNRRLERRLLPITVAVMGCVVNGPGEARNADIGVACGRGKGVLFAHGEILRTVAESEIVDALFDEIDARFA